jgi:hypothetical protein
MKAQGFLTAEDFITWMIDLLRWVPVETTQSTEMLQKISVFYFVLDREPLVQWQTGIYPNSVGNNLTALSAWIVDYAKAMGIWMDDAASLTPASFQTFNKARLYRVWECVSPDGSARVSLAVGGAPGISMARLRPRTVRATSSCRCVAVSSLTRA